MKNNTKKYGIENINTLLNGLNSLKSHKKIFDFVIGILSGFIPGIDTLDNKIKVSAIKYANICLKHFKESKDIYNKVVNQFSQI